MLICRLHLFGVSSLTEMPLQSSFNDTGDDEFLTELVTADDEGGDFVQYDSQVMSSAKKKKRHSPKKQVNVNFLCKTFLLKRLVNIIGNTVCYYYLIGEVYLLIRLFNGNFFNDFVICLTGLSSMKCFLTKCFC